MKNLKQVVEDAVKRLQVEEKEKPTKKEKKCPCNEPGIATPIRYSAKCCKKKGKTRKSKSNIKEQTVTQPCDSDKFDDIANDNDLSGLFVNNQPQAFIARMLNKYQTKGCDVDGGVLQKIKARHEDHISSGMAGPQGNKPMGPKWKDQKQSKIDFLNDVIDQCCPWEPNVGGGTGTPTVVENNSLQERFQKLANIIK